MSGRSSNAANPRQAACAVLRKIARENCHADHSIDRELKAGALQGPDRGLFAELVFGVLRRQGTLDHILSQLVSQSLTSLDHQVLLILRTGLYQLIYLDRIPESAAVNEAVNLAKILAPRAGGLVNAVLRNYLRRKDAILFPDPQCHPVEFIAARHSQPLWLVRQWLEQLGPEEAERLAEAASNPPALTLRANALCISRDELLKAWADQGIPATACRYSPAGIRVGGRHAIIELPGYHEGWFTVQDEASQLAALLLEPQPGERVLDACAAPGGKATYLAQLMNNDGELLASDLSRSKLALVRESAERLGLTIIQTRCIDLLGDIPQPDPLYDRILLDAPCSGLGVVRRNPEAKWRLSPADITRLADKQKRLLHNVFDLLKPGGRLVYSTCSTSREENEDVLTEFLSQRPDCVLDNLRDSFPQWEGLFTGQGAMRSWPHRHGMDGFFAARLIKSAS